MQGVKIKFKTKDNSEREGIIKRDIGAYILVKVASGSPILVLPKVNIIKVFHESR